MAGVENIKKVLLFPFALVKAVEQAKADGNISFADLPYFIEPITKLGDAVAAAKLVKEELKDLTAEEKGQLDAWVMQNFDIANEELEVKIEKAIGVILAIAELLTVM